MPFQACGPHVLVESVQCDKKSKFALNIRLTTSAVNVTPFTLAAERRRLVSQRSTQQQTRRTPLLLSIDGTDRQTDARKRNVSLRC